MRNEDAESHSTGAFAIQCVSKCDERKLDNIIMENRRQELIDFARAIRTRYLKGKSDSAYADAFIAEKSINSAPDESQSVSKNEKSKKRCVNCKHGDNLLSDAPCYNCSYFDKWEHLE